MYYFLKNINYKIYYPHIKCLNEKNKNLLNIFSLEPRFKNIVYNMKGIKRFNKDGIDASSLRPIKNFHSKNIMIKQDDLKYYISSPDNQPSGNLFTGLSIISSLNEKNKPIFLGDDFNYFNHSYMSFLSEEYKEAKLFFNIDNDEQLILFEILENIDENLYIKKYCTRIQLENSLDNIEKFFGHKYDNIHFNCKNDKIFYADTLLKFYKIIDSEDGYIYQNRESYLLPRSLAKEDIVALKP